MSERLTPEEQQTLSKTILEANEQGWALPAAAWCRLGRDRARDHGRRLRRMASPSAARVPGYA